MSLELTWFLSFLKNCENNTKQTTKKECVTGIVRSLQNLKYTLFALHVVDSKIHAPFTYDFLLPSLSVSAITTPTLHDSLFCSPSRSHVAPLNVTGLGSVLCLTSRKQKSSDMGKHCQVSTTTYIRHSNSKIPWFKIFQL